MWPCPPEVCGEQSSNPRTGSLKGSALPQGAEGLGGRCEGPEGEATGNGSHQARGSSSDPGPGTRQGQISGHVETVNLKINGDYWWVFRFEWGPRPSDRRETGLDLVQWRQGGGILGEGAPLLEGRGKEASESRAGQVTPSQGCQPWCVTIDFHWIKGFGW